MTGQWGRREGAGGREGQGSGPGEAGRGEDGRTGGRQGPHLGSVRSWPPPSPPLLPGSRPALETGEA